MEVFFFEKDRIDDGALKYAVIAARYQGQWIFCRHRMRTSWELPGGHREPGESIEETARRELWEETGAITFCITPVCVYKAWDHGMLYFTQIEKLDQIPVGSEIAEARLFDSLPENLTYTGIHDKLFDEIRMRLSLY